MYNCTQSPCASCSLHDRGVIGWRAGTRKPCSASCVAFQCSSDGLHGGGGVGHDRDEGLCMTMSPVAGSDRVHVGQTLVVTIDR